MKSRATPERTKVIIALGSAEVGDAVVPVMRDTKSSCHNIGVSYRGGPAAHGELSKQRGSAGREGGLALVRCAEQSVQAGRSSQEGRLPGQQSASRHASALWACKLLAGGAGAAGRLRGTDLCFAGDASLNDF